MKLDTNVVFRNDPRPLVFDISLSREAKNINMIRGTFPLYKLREGLYDIERRKTVDPVYGLISSAMHNRYIIYMWNHEN